MLRGRAEVPNVERSQQMTEVVGQGQSEQMLQIEVPRLELPTGPCQLRYHPGGGPVPWGLPMVQIMMHREAGQQQDKLDTEQPGYGLLAERFAMGGWRNVAGTM
ncbi:hypothetical protein Nwat_1999 [Nitrosococcus watsonii C-113]|uniref:Uncharacterized protein n=1 Tax=Nitrosococcus watsoni (strain C-113) TaxID=105559 RepID=D8K7F6_NITWC|nr:hypothetical protein Nwat_1999 [Nitrosococcus watsonii C-113]